jgi:hypothetical protein
MIAAMRLFHTGVRHWPLAKTGEAPALAPTTKNISFSAKHNV